MNRQISFFSYIVEKFQNIKKTDWLAIALAGAILLIIAMPSTDTKEFVGSSELGMPVLNADIEQVQTQKGKMTGDGSEERAEAYVKELEEKLEAMLRQMDGVGEVKVMITISDYGENIVEKDESERLSTVTESTSGNIDKTSVEQEIKNESIRVEDESGSYPYVEKELLPTIEGVMVVAEGGGNPSVVSDISKAAMALFPIEAHKIIVVKMSDKGDSP